MTAHEIITHLHLQPHPEGGYYSETYRPERYLSAPAGERRLCTAIYYLLSGSDKSHFHRLTSDELWLFHQGEAIELCYIEAGVVKIVLLGNNLLSGEQPQCLVPAGLWFAARIPSGRGYALVSCIVSPGFDFNDFELAQRATLLQDFPSLSTTILEFTQ